MHSAAHRSPANGQTPVALPRCCTCACVHPLLTPTPAAGGGWTRSWGPAGVLQGAAGTPVQPAYGRQAGRRAGRQAGGRAGRRAGGQAGGRAGRQAGRAGGLSGRRTWCSFGRKYFCALHRLLGNAVQDGCVKNQMHRMYISRPVAAASPRICR
jgi:hypothetical protein